MTLLWLGFGIMVVVACGILLWPVFVSRSSSGDGTTAKANENGATDLATSLTESKVLSRAEMNAMIYRQRLGELEQEHAADRISSAQFTELKAELDHTLVRDVDADDSTGSVSDTVKRAEPASVRSASGVQRKGLNRIAILFSLVPAGAFVFYGLLSYNKEVVSWIQLVNELDPSITKVLANENGALEEFSDVPVSKFVHVLQHYLQSNDSKSEGWYLLGSTYMGAKLYEPASQAFRKAYEIDPTVADYGRVYAQSLMSMNDGRLNRESASLFQKLSRDFPKDMSIRMLYGMAAFRSNQFELAIDRWQGILDYRKRSGQTDSVGETDNATEEAEALLARSITLARQQLNKQRAPRQDTAQSGSQPSNSIGNSGEGRVNETPNSADSQAEISVVIELDKTIVAQVSSTDTLFVLAKAMKGPAVPLAARRIPISQVEWPLTVTLTDSDAMIPQMNLSSSSLVQIIARISKSGEAIAQTGDYYGKIVDISTQSSASDTKALGLTIINEAP